MRIEWVHPTWRDLVIGMLIGEDGARRHFLRRCGVHGVELALSTAGGATGERRLPLIRSDEDWDALGDRLYELVAELEPQDLIAALAALGTAIDDLPAEREVNALARTVLVRAASVWNAARRPIAVDLLDAWLSVGSRLEPRPAPPELAITWAALLPAKSPERGDRAALERFADWLVLCELLRGYEDSLLEELGFGSDQLALALAFVIELERHPEVCSAATEEPALRALESIGRLAPEYRSVPSTVARRLRRTAIEQAGPAPLSQRDLAREFADLGTSGLADRVLADL